MRGICTIAALAALLWGLSGCSTVITALLINELLNDEAPKRNWSGVVRDTTGEPVGGMVSPLGVLGFGDALWNTEFWNNVRDASGMYHWGRKLDMPELVDRAERTINLALQSPQNDAGFFCLVYKAEEKQWLRSSLGPGAPGAQYTIFSKQDQFYNVPAMSKTAAHMLEF